MNPWLVEYKLPTDSEWGWEHAGPFNSRRMAEFWVDRALEGMKAFDEKIEYRVRQYQPVCAPPHSGLDDK